MEKRRAKRYDHPLTLAYIDLDNFKQVNDRFGHNTGDNLLSLVVHVIRDGLRSTDAVARLGGDEFGVLLSETNSAAATSGTSALMTFGDLVDHYRQTELLADNKTEKTRSTYLVYLRKWILPTWGDKYLHNIKAVAVEQWLRNLGELSNGSKCKIRNIMSAIFSHAIRYEFADRNPITAVRQSGKRGKVPVLLDVPELHRLFDELQLCERR
jgi:GGDEF domain-containing protein